jgi:hypothetical protein
MTNMKRCLAIAVFVVGANLVPLMATTVILPSPTVGVAVGGIMVDTSSLVITYDPATKLARLSGPLNSPGAWTLTIDLTTNPDPSVSYAVTAGNDTGAPLAFSFTFMTPVALGPYNRVSNQVRGSGTDRNDDGATVSDITQVALLNGSGVPSVALGAYTCAGNSCEDGSGFGMATSAVASAYYTALGANVKFTVSALDSASVNGTAVLDHAPEPASVALTFLGLLLVPIGLRLRRKC